MGFSIGFIALYAWIYDLNHIKTLSINISIFSVLYSFPQVILYQGFLMKVGKKLFKKSWVNITVNVLLFTSMHIFYHLPWFDYVLLAFAGLGFSWTYSKCKNIYLVGLFHFILNLIAIHLGMFASHIN